MAKPKNGFPKRWRKFISHYLKTLNATESAINAGYSEKSAAEIGCRLLKRESIKGKIAEELEKTLGADRATLRTQVIEELRQEAFAESTFEDATKNGTVTRANPNKLRALEILAKYAKLLEDAPAVSNTFILQWPNDSNPTP